MGTESTDDPVWPHDRSSDLLTGRETAIMLRMSMATLERLRASGGGPAYIKLGNTKRARVVYRRHDVHAWLLAHYFPGSGSGGRHG